MKVKIFKLKNIKRNRYAPVRPPAKKWVVSLQLLEHAKDKSYDGFYLKLFETRREAREYKKEVENNLWCLREPFWNMIKHYISY